MATRFSPKSAKHEQTFLYFDPLMQAWDTQAYTLAELAELPDISPESIVCTADGVQQMTYGELLEKPLVQEVYHYEVVTHGKYVNDIFDAAGLKAKLNALGERGYRLAGFGMVSGTKKICTSEREAMKDVAIYAAVGLDADSTVSQVFDIRDYRVAVAVMEKKS